MGRLSELLAALGPSAKQLVATRGALPLRTLLPAEPVNLDMPAYVPTLANRHSVAVKTAGGKSVVAPSPDPKVDDHGDGHEHGHGHGHGSGHGHTHEDGMDCSTCAKTEMLSRHARYGLSSFVYR